MGVWLPVGLVQNPVKIGAKSGQNRSQSLVKMDHTIGGTLGKRVRLELEMEFILRGSGEIWGGSWEGSWEESGQDYSRDRGRTWAGI